MMIKNTLLIGVVLAVATGTGAAALVAPGYLYVQQYAPTEFVRTDTVTLEETTYKAWEMRIIIKADGWPGTDWTDARLDIELTSGSLYNHPLFGNDDPPMAALVAVYPDLGYDTFVQRPNGEAARKVDELIWDGGEFKLLPKITDTSMHVSWFDSVRTDPGTWTLARITLSDDANGTLDFTTYDVAHAYILVVPFFDPLYIRNGEIVPEPATLSLLAVGALVLRRRRRMKR